MKRIATFLLVLSALNAQAQETAVSILSKMVANIKAHESITYIIEQSTKFETGNGGKLKSMVHLLRDKTDTIWGGKVWISEEAKNTHSIYSFYDMNKTYTIMTPINKAYGDRPVKNRMGLSIQHNGLVWADFLHPEVMERKYYKATDVKLMKDTVVNGKSCYQVSLSPYYGMSQVIETEILCITKSDHFPIYVKNVVVKKSGIMHTETLITLYSFDKVSANQFSVQDQVPSTYKIETRDREMPKGVQVEPRIDKSQFPIPGNRRR